MLKGKQQQSKQVGNQQEEVEVSIQEEPFWQEAPVNCPLEQKLTAKIKCLAYVANGILQEERQTQQELLYKDRFIKIWWTPPVKLCLIYYRQYLPVCLHTKKALELS